MAKASEAAGKSAGAPRTLDPSACRRTEEQLVCQVPGFGVAYLR